MSDIDLSISGPPQGYIRPQTSCTLYEDRIPLLFLDYLTVFTTIISDKKSRHPREDIISSIQKSLWSIDGVALVERNLRQLANPGEFPAVFIIDLGDEVDVPTARPTIEYRRIWNIVIVSIIQGSSEEAAIKELAAFQNDAKKAVYANNKTVGRQYKGSITESFIEPIAFLNIGNNVVAQGMHFEIRYVASLAHL